MQFQYIEHIRNTSSFSCRGRITISHASFWPLISPIGIHQNPETSSVHPTADGCPDDHLHRRHIDHSIVQEPSPRTLTSLSTSSRIPEVHYEYREVCTDFRPDHRVSESHCQLHQYGATTTSYQDEADLSRVSTDNEDGRVNLGQNPGMSSGQDKLNSLRNTPTPHRAQRQPHHQSHHK